MRKGFCLSILVVLVVTFSGARVAMAGALCSAHAGEKADDGVESVEPEETARKKNAENIVEKEYADGDLTKTEYVQAKQQLNDQEL